MAAIDWRVTLKESAALYEEVVTRHLPKNSRRIPVFDAILLGVGPDGHTCSLFPAHPALGPSTEWEYVAYVNDSPKPPPQRITLTFTVINAAREVAFIAAGGNKSDVIARCLLDRDASLPITHVAPDSEGASLHWFMDEAASRELDRRSRDMYVEKDS